MSWEKRYLWDNLPTAWQRLAAYVYTKSRPSSKSPVTMVLWWANGSRCDIEKWWWTRQSFSQLKRIHLWTWPGWETWSWYVQNYVFLGVNWAVKMISSVKHRLGDIQVHYSNKGALLLDVREESINDNIRASIVDVFWSCRRRGCRPRIKESWSSTSYGVLNKTVQPKMGGSETPERYRRSIWGLLQNDITDGVKWNGRSCQQLCVQTNGRVLRCRWA